MPGDGHSKADCFTAHFDTPLDKLLHLLEKELQEKISKYLDFSEYHDDKIVS